MAAPLSPPDRKEIRDQVMARIIEVMVAAEDQGGDAMVAARRAFPGTPEAVLIDAWLEVDDRKMNAWWEGVEKTIDGALIERALTAGC